MNKSINRTQYGRKKINKLSRELSSMFDRVLDGVLTTPHNIKYTYFIVYTIMIIYCCKHFQKKNIQR